MDERIRIIAFTGHIGVGKSTAANYLVEHYGYKLIKFADPLKDMLRALGVLTEAQLNGSGREIPVSILGNKTPRFAMQTLGTEWGRETINRDLWAELWAKDATNYYRCYGGFVVADDCRFINECDKVKDFGGTIINIRRKDFTAIKHDSEAEADYLPADYVYQNNQSVTDLFSWLDTFLKGKF